MQLTQAPSGVASIIPGQFTIATLPAAADNTRRYAWATDLFDGQADYVLSDGVNWKPVRPLAGRIVANANSNMTLKALQNSPTQILQGTLSLQRTLTLDDQYAYSGARFRIKREAGGLSLMIINDLLSNILGSMAGSTWADYEFLMGVGWKQTASGGLL